MEEITPTGYAIYIKVILKREADKINSSKKQVLLSDQYEIASQFRDLEKKLLDFIKKL
jgi:hypothetical protein